MQLAELQQNAEKKVPGKANESVQDVVKTRLVGNALDSLCFLFLKKFFWKICF